MRRYMSYVAAALLSSAAIPAVASAEVAHVTTDLNMRAGPSTEFPVVVTIDDGAPVDVYGCVRGYSWCDVSWAGYRGWVYASYLTYPYEGRVVPIVEYGPQIDLPIISFSIGTYWDDYYRGKPWYGRRAHWRRVWGDRDFHDRDHRGRDRDHRAERPDRDRDADRRENRAERPEERRDNRAAHRQDRREKRAERREERRDNRAEHRQDRREKRAERHEERRDNRAEHRQDRREKRVERRKERREQQVERRQRNRAAERRAERRQRSRAVERRVERRQQSRQIERSFRGRQAQPRFSRGGGDRGRSFDRRGPGRQAGERRRGRGG